MTFGKVVPLNCNTFLDKLRALVVASTGTPFFALIYNVGQFPTLSCRQHDRFFLSSRCVKQKSSIMASVISASRAVITNPTNKHTATLFFFHGSGSNGKDLEAWVSSLTSSKFVFPHIKVVYPTAPLQPYTPLGSMRSNVWFDRSAIAISAPEKQSCIDSTCESVMELIEKEVASGIPLKRIVIGGFSMGGALSLHLGYRHKTSLAGCFVLSSFLNNNSLVYEALKLGSGQSTPPLLQLHGTSDDLVPLKWGVTTHNTLKSLGVKGTMTNFEDVGHELVANEVAALEEWLLNILPGNN